MTQSDDDLHLGLLLDRSLLRLFDRPWHSRHLLLAFETVVVGVFALIAQDSIPRLNALTSELFLHGDRTLDARILLSILAERRIITKFCSYHATVIGANS